MVVQGVRMKHCAKFTDALLPVALDLLDGVLAADIWRDPVFKGPAPRVLDPFAGTGKGVEYLRSAGYDAVGVELEPEWAHLSPHVFRGSALTLPWRDGEFDVVFTSPTYGNRMADRDQRESVSGTYMKSLGHEASTDSSCHLQWGPKYRAFHELAWAEADRVLRPGGYFLLNCKNHPRNKVEQKVTEWHTTTLILKGYEVVKHIHVPVTGNGFGANKDTALPYESLVLMQKAA